jgi:hypothetical protein
LPEKWWIILNDSGSIELHGPYFNQVEASLKLQGFKENVGVSGVILLSQEKLVTLLEKMTDTLED